MQAESALYDGDLRFGEYSLLYGFSSGSMSSEDAASASYPHAVWVVAEAFGVVAEARGEGRAGGGGGVICDTLACVLRTSERRLLNGRAGGGCIRRGTKRRWQYGLRHWSVTPGPGPASASAFRFSPSEATHPPNPPALRSSV